MGLTVEMPFSAMKLPIKLLNSFKVVTFLLPRVYAY